MKVFSSSFYLPRQDQDPFYTLRIRNIRACSFEIESFSVVLDHSVRDQRNKVNQK